MALPQQHRYRRQQVDETFLFQLCRSWQFLPKSPLRSAEKRRFSLGMAGSPVGEGDLVYSTRDVALRNGIQGSDIWVVVHGAVHDVTKYEKVMMQLTAVCLELNWLPTFS
jgi:hypothetical protein